MRSDPFAPEPPVDLLAGTASVAKVTDAMLAHAAEEVAKAAEAVADGHATATSGSDASEPADDGPTATTMVVETERPQEPWVAPASSGDVTPGAAPEDPFRAGPAAEDRDVAAGQVGGTAAAGEHPADTVSRYTSRLADIVRHNIDATTAHFSALVAAKTPVEAWALNAAFFQHQVDVLTLQGRELGGLAEQVFFDALRADRGEVARR